MRPAGPVRCRVGGGAAENRQPGASVTDLARELLDRNGGLAGLLNASPRSLFGRGVAEAKVASVIAALEIACRLARSEIPDREPMENPGSVAHYLSLRYQRRDQEVMGALFLDTRNRLIGESDPFRGTLNRTTVEPWPILKEGLLRGAAGVVLFHTHPSGDPSPSAEDVAFTRQMAEAGDAVGIRLVDHLILGSGGRWVSLRRLPQVHCAGCRETAISKTFLARSTAMVGCM